MKKQLYWTCFCKFLGLWALILPGFLLAQTSPYLPDLTYNPLKIRVNFIIVQRADGSGNFQDNAADRAFLRNMIFVTNSVFSNLVDRNEEYYPGKKLPFLSNAKIEIVPNILFKRDEIGWNNRNDHNFAGVPELSGWYLDHLDREIYHTDTLPKAINLYFTTDGKLYEQMVVLGTTTDYDKQVFFKQHAASEIPVWELGDGRYGRFHTMRCHIGNVWLKLWWKRKVLQDEDWKMEYEVGKSIAHELGHLMGLSHTSDQHLHALMRTQFGGFRDYLMTKEIARIHESFGHAPTLWQFVPDDFSYGSPTADWIITQNETWKDRRRLYANIVIKAGATLTIANEVWLPPTCTVQVEQGATLVLNNGSISFINSPETLVWVEDGKSAANHKSRSTLTEVITNTAQGGMVLLRGKSRMDPSVLSLALAK